MSEQQYISSETFLKELDRAAENLRKEVKKFQNVNIEALKKALLYAAVKPRGENGGGVSQWQKEFIFQKIIG